jgi:hypothetical protein
VSSGNSSGTSSSSNLTAAERAAYITELTEIQSSLDANTKQYEKKYGESYFKIASTNDSSTNNISPIGNNNNGISQSISSPVPSSVQPFSRPPLIALPSSSTNNISSTNGQMYLSAQSPIAQQQQQQLQQQQLQQQQHQQQQQSQPQPTFKSNLGGRLPRK